MKGKKYIIHSYDEHLLPDHFRIGQYFPQRPHERSVDPKQSLAIDHVGLVKHDSNFFNISIKRLNYCAELVRNVKFVSIKQEENYIRSFSKPSYYKNRAIYRNRVLARRRACVSYINFLPTDGKSYWRLTLCFSPLSTPGVSINTILSSIEEGVCDTWNFVKNGVPKWVRDENGKSGDTAAAFPGITFSSPLMTATNRSVVGSGPMWEPGYSLPRRYLMNDDFPTEYWPNKRTIGFDMMSASVRDGEWNWSNE